MLHVSCCLLFCLMGGCALLHFLFCSKLSLVFFPSYYSNLDCLFVFARVFTIHTASRHFFLFPQYDPQLLFFFQQNIYTLDIASILTFASKAYALLVKYHKINFARLSLNQKHAFPPFLYGLISSCLALVCTRNYSPST